MAECRPGASAPGGSQDPAGVLERPRPRQPVGGRHPHIVQRDVGLPHRAQRHLPLNHPRLEPGCSLLHHEGADLAVFRVAGPHDDKVGHGAQADPPLPAVQHPSVPVGAGRGFQRDRVRSVLRLGQREGAQLVHPRHVGQPARLLFLRAAHRDRLHGQARVHAEDHAEAAVPAVQLHGHQPARQRAHPRAPVSLDVLADNAEFRQPADELPRDLGPFPVRPDDRHDLLVDEPPDGGEVRPLLVGELLPDGKEVRAEGFPQLRARDLCHSWLLSPVRSASRNASTAGPRRSASAASSR